MEYDLFRQQVMETRRGGWLGTIHVVAPLSHWTWTALGVFLVAAIIAFLVFGHYTQRARVIGQLVPTTGLLVVTTVAAGTATHVFVHQGQAVVEGEPLVEISSDRASAELGSMRADISIQLRRQLAQLRGSLSTQKKLAAQRSAGRKTKIRSLHSQKVQIHDQLTLQKQHIANTDALLTRIRPLLDKGYISAFKVDQRQTALLNAKVQLKALSRQELDAHQQIQAANQKLTELPLELATQTSTITGEIANIHQQLTQNEAKRATLLRAPRDGVISTLLAKNGQHVATGQSLVSIVPQDATLEARLLVPSRAAGFIDPGSRVVLRYQAYPYQKFGQQYGRVSSISRSALSSEEIVAMSGQRPKEPLYRVKVTLDRQNILAYGKPKSLKPGMALSADILMDRRSLIEWAFEPLYGFAQHTHTGGDARG